MTGAHGYAKTVEQCSHVEMMYVANEERHYRILALGGAEEAHIGYLSQLLHAVFCEFVLMSGDVVHAESRHIINGGCKSVSGYIVRSACLKLER